MLDFVPLVAMAALVVAFVNFLKFITNGDSNGWTTQLIVWVSGVGAIILVAETDYASAIIIGDMALNTLNVFSKIFVGLTLGSTATVLNEFKKAFDNKDDATKPKFINKES